ncbi:MAG: SET domain-containing protein-lysine N-methyltransferase [Acidobacteriota bacterium]
MTGDVRIQLSSIQGLGVFAAKEFEVGQTVLLVDDSRVVDADHPLNPERGEHPHHCDYLAGGRVVLMRPPERYINSSCDPNTFVKSRQGIRHLIALRPIAVGEEITCEYVLNCHGGEEWECRCQSPHCRGRIPSSFFDLPREKQIKLLPLLDDWFVEEHREKIEALQRKP